MTANSTPESFDAVVAEMWKVAEYDRDFDLLDRLQSAHARELAEQQATIEALRGEVARRTRECELKQAAIDRWIPCPDHRDKTERGVCQVCAREKAEARADAAMGLLRETTAVAITMLYDSHKADTLAEFSTAELGLVVAASAPLLAKNAQVEHVYRRAWDAATEALAGGERKDD
jgi:hypothetical protein